MADIYIDYTNGNDTTGAGTSGNPYKTLSKAFTLCAAGDTVKIANTSVQPIGDLAFPAISTSYDAWLLLEGWDNGGAIVIEKPDGDISDVGAISGRFTGSLSFVRFKNLKFENYSLGNNTINNNNPIQVFNGCYFDSTLSISGGACIGMNAGVTVRHCMFNNIVASTSGNCISTVSTNNGGLIHGCYFYNCKNAILCNGGRITIAFCIFDQTEGYAINLGNDVISISNCTIIGDGSASNKGITFANTTSEYLSIFDNHFQDFSGASSSAINNTAQTWPTTPGTFNLVGGNSFYNNTQNYESGGNFAASISSDERSTDIIEASDPLVDVAGKNYSKKATANSFTSNPLFSSFPYSNTLTNMTTGAVQNEGGSGGGGGGSGGSYTFS